MFLSLAHASFDSQCRRNSLPFLQLCDNIKIVSSSSGRVTRKFIYAANCIMDDSSREFYEFYFYKGT